MPVLNRQVPKSEDWRKYEVNEKANKITLKEILIEKEKTT